MPSYRLPGLPEDDPGRSRVLPWVEIPHRDLGSSRRGRRNGPLRRGPFRRQPRPRTPARAAPRPVRRRSGGPAVRRSYSPSSPRGTGCSTSASTRFAINRAVRTTEPLRVTSLTSTTPRRTAVSTRRPARLATTSYVRVVSPASTTISTRSPFTVPIPLLRRPFEITHARTRARIATIPAHFSRIPGTTDNPSADACAASQRAGPSIRKLCTSDGRQWTAAVGAPRQGLGKGPPHRR